jgi:arsenate reductase (thioredoxin)
MIAPHAPVKVLFLCNANTARSQMAEALLRHRHGDRFAAFSAGLKPAGIHPLAKPVLEEIGVTIAGQRSKSVTEYLGTAHFGYIITLCGAAEDNCPTAFPDVAVRLHWPVDDPARPGTPGEMLTRFRAVRDELDRRIAAWVAGLASHEHDAR